MVGEIYVCTVEYDCKFLELCVVIDTGDNDSDGNSVLLKFKDGSVRLEEKSDLVSGYRRVSLE